MIRRALEYFRGYVDEGRLSKLIWLLVASLAIAFVEWSLSPGIAHLWIPPTGISDKVYFVIFCLLAFGWACVVCAGFYKCGWPALLLLISAKWGLFPIYMIGALFWACTHGDCI